MSTTSERLSDLEIALKFIQHNENNLENQIKNDRIRITNLENSQNTLSNQIAAIELNEKKLKNDIGNSLMIGGAVAVVIALLNKFIFKF